MTTKLKKKDVAPLLSATFPQYHGRTFKLDVRAEYTVDSASLTYQGGSKKEVVCLRQTSSGIDKVELSAVTPWDGITYGGKIPADVMIVEHERYGGVDCGLCFIVAPGSKFLPAVLPAARDIEVANILSGHGYDPTHAHTLEAEGMGPEELKGRLAMGAGNMGSLEYTHGIHKLAAGVA